MVKRTTMGRFAFTMIELIFAIVIISIAVMSLPMMIQTTSKGIEDNIVQEAIFAASAELMGATSYYWDLNSMSDANISRLERVINVDGDCNTTTNLRPGHVNQPYHRRCLDTGTTIENTSSTEYPNLDNAVHGAEVIFTDTTTNKAGYKNAYKSIVSISPVDETGNTDYNIKKITAVVTNSNDDNITALNIYSTNIGEIDYYKRRF